jgi:hypothetical protein
MSTDIHGNCVVYGTSNLTIQLTDLDNKAKILCVEESNLSSESLTIETESITVYCKFSGLAEGPRTICYIRL